MTEAAGGAHGSPANRDLAGDNTVGTILTFGTSVSKQAGRDGLPRRRFALPASLIALVQLSRPVEEAKQIPLLPPNEAEKVRGTDGVRLSAGIGLDSPAEVIAAPWAKAVPASRIPEELDGVSHNRTSGHSIGSPSALYIRSNSVPCFSSATMTDSRADCCVWLVDRAVAAAGRSVCSRFVWFTVSCVRSCVA